MNKQITIYTDHLVGRVTMTIIALSCLWFYPISNAIELIQRVQQVLPYWNFISWWIWAIVVFKFILHIIGFVFFSMLFMHAWTVKRNTKVTVIKNDI